MNTEAKQAVESLRSSHDLDIIDFGLYLMAADLIDRLTAENAELHSKVARLEAEIDEMHTTAAAEFADAIMESHL